MRCDEAEVELPDENNICMLGGAVTNAMERGTLASILNATTLGRTTSVVGQRSNIDDFGYFNACTMHCADG